MNFDLLSGINALGGGVLGYLIPFLFVLTLLVFFHELRHFVVARICGVRVVVCRWGGFRSGFLMRDVGAAFSASKQTTPTVGTETAARGACHLNCFSEKSAPALQDRGVMASRREENAR